jgi:hypothetical protein
MSGNARCSALLSKLLDDALTDEELGELRELLAQDPNAKSELVDQLLLDTLLAESLGEEPLTALVDLIGQSPVSATGAEEDNLALRQAPIKHKSGRWMSISGWLAAAASLFLMGVLFLFTGEREAFASATQIVEAAIRTHAALIERIYAVGVQRGTGGDATFTLPRDVRIATQGDRFWVQVRGLRDWVWGRDEQGAVWVALGPNKAVFINPSEMGPQFQHLSQLYTLNVETLLKSLVKQCRLELVDTKGGLSTIVATPRQTWLNRALQRVTIEIDRETKAIQKLVIEREYEQVKSTSTFTLIDSRQADESLYRPEGHLTAPFQIFGAETTPETRLGLLDDWFGARSGRWIKTK